jgi:DNA-binding winged helix-turn-helix (wHTH) protein/tetratricopeptide (TPR) repeat protein
MAGIATQSDMSIDLATEPDFRLGALNVSPSLREVSGAGFRAVLEPRVMAVLAALAAEREHTVSRDRLLARCWGGVVVGEDAINRAIAKVRKLADQSGAFAVETIPRVGFRLVEAPSLSQQPVSDPIPAAPAPTETAPGPSIAPAARTRWRVAVLVAAGLLVPALVLWLSLQGPASAPSVAIDAGAATLVERGLAAVMEHEPVRVEQGMAWLREAVVQAPDSPRAQGALALGYAHLLVRIAHDQQPQALKLSEAAAARALAINPRQPEALAARAMNAQVFGNWAESDALTRAAMEATDADSDVIVARVRLLQQSGRSSEALALTRTAVARDQLALLPRIQEGSMLEALGRADEADRVLATNLRLFPGNYMAWFNRFYFLAYSGRLAEAEAMLNDREGLPRGIPENDLQRSRRLLAALADRQGADAAAALAEAVARADEGRGHLEVAVRLAAALGDADTAFRLMRFHYLSPISSLPDVRFPGQSNFGRANERWTGHLFGPPVDRLQGDPRFLQLMQEIGLVDYWRQSGTAPDFCRRHLPACRAAGIPLDAEEAGRTS